MDNTSDEAFVKPSPTGRIYNNGPVFQSWPVEDIQQNRERIRTKMVHEVSERIRNADLSKIELRIIAAYVGRLHMEKT